MFLPVTRCLHRCQEGCCCCGSAATAPSRSLPRQVRLAAPSTTLATRSEHDTFTRNSFLCFLMLLPVPPPPPPPLLPFFWWTHRPSYSLAQRWHRGCSRRDARLRPQCRHNLARAGGHRGDQLILPGAPRVTRISNTGSSRQKLQRCAQSTHASQLFVRFTTRT